MSPTKLHFPIVADGEPVCQPSREMALYENEDLITNIRGNYQEKSYDRQLTESPSSAPMSSYRAQRQLAMTEGKSYAQEARARAKQDIKKKKQTYLTKEIKPLTKERLHKDLTATLPKPVDSNTDALTRAAERLRQETYILAEIPKVYKEPKNKAVSNKTNNYEFLKRSQIYNKEKQDIQKERQVAQELNLTRFEDVN